MCISAVLLPSAHVRLSPVHKIHMMYDSMIACIWENVCGLPMDPRHIKILQMFLTTHESFGSLVSQANRVTNRAQIMLHSCKSHCSLQQQIVDIADTISAGHQAATHECSQPACLLACHIDQGATFPGCKTSSHEQKCLSIRVSAGCKLQQTTNAISVNTMIHRRSHNQSGSAKHHVAVFRKTSSNQQQLQHQQLQHHH